MVLYEPVGGKFPETHPEYIEAIQARADEKIKKVYEELGLPLPVDLAEHPTPEELKQRVARVIPLTEEEERFYEWKAKNRPDTIDIKELDEVLQRPDGIDSLL